MVSKRSQWPVGLVAGTVSFVSVELVDLSWYSSRSGWQTVDIVNFDECVAAVRTAPLRLFSEMQRRTCRPVEGFGVTVGTVGGNLETHMTRYNIGPVKICVQSLSEPIAY